MIDKEEGQHLNPSAVARRWGCKVTVVHKLIRRGELAAINLSVDLHTRPRWKIPVEEVARFELARTVVPTSSTTPMRRRRPVASSMREFF